MDTAKTDRFIADAWDGDIVPQLVEYIRIPNKSPMFDAKWKENGYMDDAVKLLANWAKAQPIAGMQVQVLELEGRTPLIYIEIEGEGEDRKAEILAVHRDGEITDVEKTLLGQKGVQARQHHQDKE